MPTWKPPESADSLPKMIRSGCGSSAAIASTSAAAVASGSQSAPSVSSRIARSAPIAIASRSCSSASAGPSVSTVTDAAAGLDDPHGLLDAALLVRADREAEVAGLDRALVRGEDHLAAGQRHALDADEDVHQDRMRVFSGSKIGVEPATATVTG